ncbi:MAG TPA: leucyl/phenylalanyl-tRNA--protein transferase [Novosphingobium sp.]|nr:leucyl/phenylalanyl-tRNA--protein transferase [Novosphingobium sp.]
MHAPVAPPPIEPELLMLAYRSGVFPMADAHDDPQVFWVEPRRRAILPLDGLRVSRSLARTLRRGRFEVTCNAAFDAVIAACAEAASDRAETWISGRIAASYRALHRASAAHSIECWQGGELVGGLYGVGFDRAFCGESMFSRVPDASKVALAWLVAALRRGGATLLDCQFMTDHLASLGAVEISQKRYLALLRAAQAGVGAAEGVAAGAGEAGGAALADGAGLGLPDGFAALRGDAFATGLASSPGKLIAQFLTQTS